MKLNISTQMRTVSLPCLHGSVPTRLSKTVLQSQLSHVYFSPRLRASACVLWSCGPYTAAFRTAITFLSRESVSHRIGNREAALARTFLSREGVPVLTAAGLLTCRSCGTSSSSHMPLLVSKLRSVLSHWRARLHTPLGGGGGGGGGGMPPWGRGGGRNGGGGGGKPSVGRVAPCCMIGPAAGPGESDVWLGRTACTHRIQFLPSVCGCKKTCSVRQFEDMSRKPGRRVFL